ncbi:MAG: hypothetical protein K2L49_09250, partial [Muribaculaceae bacterium]|nr:hypothetical protein [Muribaculaceae bacterium]
MRIVGKLLVSVVLGLMPVSGMAFKIEGNRVEQVDFGTIRVDERECSPDLLLPVLTKEVTYVDSARMRQDQAEVQSMIGQMGKKFENPFQRDMVERAMKYMQRTDNKYYAKVRSDYEKGIISKKLKEYLSDLADDYSNILGALGGNERLRSIGNNLRSRRLVNAADYYATRTDTLINPCVRSGYGDAGCIGKYADWIISTRLDNLYAVKDWKWVFSEKAEPVLEGFPARVSWLRYKRYPQYRIIPIRLTIGFYGENFTENVADFGRYCESILAFDSYGNLTHVIWSELPSPYKTGRQHYLARQIYAQAYRANDYNIHSYGKATEHYIKVQIGLEELTAKEKTDMAALRKQCDDAGLARDKARALYGQRSAQARQAESRANRLSAAVLSLHLNNGVPYDSDG